MMKNYLLIAFLISSFQLFFQEAYFLAVNILTTLTFKISYEAMTMQLQTVAGSTHGMGYSIPFNINKK